jgi:integrase
VQTHRLTLETLKAARVYLEKDAPEAGCIWRGSNKVGTLTDDGFSIRAINAHIRRLGEVVGIENLSPHDLRHTWATMAAKKTPVHVLKEAGGWSSPAMAFRYIEAAKIANDGVIL